MADLDKLRKQRGYVKGKLTRLENALAQVQNQAATLDKEDAEVQRQIIEEIGEPTQADVEAEAEFEERSLAVQATLRRIINGARNANASTTEHDTVLTQLLQRQMTMMERYETGGASRSPTTQGSEDDGHLGNLLRAQTEILQRLSDGATDGVVRGSRVKLPTIKLPSFDGKIEEWTKFYDAFIKTIHSNQILPNIQKFIYLRSCVSGAAARAIEDIELSDDNYTVAWEQLKKRFEDSGVIKRRHVQCLFEMPLVEKESASAIMHLVDHVNKHTRVLKRLGAPTDSWGDLLLHMVESKLDRVTLRAWEERASIHNVTSHDDEVVNGESNFNALIDFLIQRCHALERIESSKVKEISSGDKGNFKKQAQFKGPAKSYQPKSNVTDKVTSLASSITAGACFLCQEAHLLYNCDKFLTMTPEEREREARRLRLCINCLRNDHFTRSCKHGSCRECSGRHNTLLHRSTTAKQQNTIEAADTSNADNSAKTACHSMGATRKNVFMATAIVDASNSEGYRIPVRVLLDSGSEANFITHNICNRLNLKRNATSEIVSGINDATCQVRQVTNVTIKSKHSNFQVNAQCFIVPKISSALPSKEIDKNALNIPCNLRLADSEFSKRHSIDLLIGAEFFFDLLENGKIELCQSKLFLQNTKLGWVIAGSMPSNERKDTNNVQMINIFHCSLAEDENLDKTIKQFWEIENYANCTKSKWSNEEARCEQIYKDTTTRDDHGRFVVSLPFKSEDTTIGETRNTALKRLNQIERRFKNDKLYYERYLQFMREYYELQHMSLVESFNVNDNKRVVYLPHHGVVKETSSTTKLRVVFNASSKGSTGRSLNDILMTGPILQDNLIPILLRFRFYNIAVTGDLEKMYRQVSVRDCDRDYQRILWRFSMDEPIKEYRLNTVTYGQASASYLAIRSVRQLAEEYEGSFPLAAKCVLNDMYVDDIIGGAQTIDEAKELQRQLIELMSKGCFKVHKWHSNVTGAVHNLSKNENQATVDLKLNDVVRTLGLVWEPSTDVFLFTIRFNKQVRSKRELLSEISKLFDPLGLLGPVITLAKLLMQETWKIEINWDSELPASTLSKWEKLQSELSNSPILRIPRRISSQHVSQNLILYGFCDASQDAYGACVYVKNCGKDEHVAQLLCSKSRVAPLKTISIPRLELCSALLLARLIDQIKQACKFEFSRVFAFTDSLVTLYWIRGDLSRWKPFVANRISELTDLLPVEIWAHVRSEDNPADVLSRGAYPTILQTCNLWWEGPPWISSNSDDFQSQGYTSEAQAVETEEIKSEERRSKVVSHHTRMQDAIFQHLYSRISDLNKLERVLAYCLRFISRCKAGSKESSEQLTIAEIETARSHLVKNAQAEGFQEEILVLRQAKQIKHSSKLLSLHPFLDDQGLLRVGGRLRNAPLSFSQKHPILLPANHKLTRIVIEREHKRLLHAGPQALLAAIRRKYWPLRGRDIVRKVYHSCVWCSRRQPHASSQLMGNLPADRVTPSRPFYNCGVDFAGPFITLLSKGRGRKTTKSYLALFVCFATKAIHLEAVSDLSTEAFLATLKRFIGRRGCPQKIYSDNATNFKGAQREISEMYTFLQQQVKGSLHKKLLEEGLQWIFIPPYSPHWGGLWEAGVKSCKNLLRTVLGNSNFTFEELCTALIQVESCLNSRPLYALSNDPSDLEPLTPGHFLVEGPLTSLPEINLQDINIHRLNRWQLVQRSCQDFWKRWAAEYVSSLQGRFKWQKTQQDLQIGDLVIIREDHTPSYQWKLGRVTELHRGQDNCVRVVTIRTASGVTKRAINKLCKLPIKDKEEDYD
ncbi:uncharacterized protein LOC105201565 [Solenopsis invicta]|uniref:uncharacterized protein LOC105201565 n=1 Tax=Solenopsis invicta TaxID=13686 RepID=UPI00193E6E72|nr:uncharacterized protein LOC105201565 [Solenopsis invicta]